jgi:hypothetical protein
MNPGRPLSPIPAARPGALSPAAPVVSRSASTLSTAMWTALWTARAGLAVFPVHKLGQEA